MKKTYYRPVDTIGRPVRVGTYGIVRKGWRQILAHFTVLNRSRRLINRSFSAIILVYALADVGST